MKSRTKLLMLIVILIIAVLSLSSCSINELMASVTGVNKDPAYVEWQKLNTRGQLDEDGKYINKAVHVTFGKNACLEIRYYSDKEMTDQIDEDLCYLLPGDCIYAKIINEQNPYTDLYKFKTFRIWDYDETGRRTSELKWYPGSGELVFMLPNEYTGTNIGIEPIGEYSERTLKFEDRIEDAPDRTIQGSSWKINGNDTVNETYKVNPVEAYTVEYHFNKDRYYYRSSTPGSFFAGDGIVCFEQNSPTGGNDTYSVVLAEYYSTTLLAENGEIKSVSINNTEQQLEKGTKEKRLDKLKKEDKITVVASTDKVSCGNEWPHKSADCQPSGNDYIIVFSPGNDDDFVLDPSAYTIESGTLQFFVDGEEITTKRNIAGGKVIECEILNMGEDFWLPYEINPITVKGEETKDELSSIKVWPHKLVKINLPKIPGGSIIYTADGQDLTGDTATLYSGTIISANAIAWNGWSVNQSQLEYQAGKDETQIFPVPSDIFIETDKPKLTIKVKGNITKATIDVTADALILDKNPILYPTKDIITDIFGKAEKTIVDNKEIGSANDIRLTLQDTELAEGTEAIHITVSRNGADAEEMVISANDSANIAIYPDGNREELCKSITIKLEATSLFENREVEHITTSISAKDGNAITSEYLLPDTRIQLLLTPDESCYFVGANVKDDCYSRELSYAEYIRDLEKIIREQLRFKKQVMLVSEGQYGIATYKLNGQECSSTVLLKDTDTLTAEYKITDEQYQIITKTALVFDSGVSQTTYQFNIADIDSEINVESYLDIRKKAN